MRVFLGSKNEHKVKLNSKRDKLKFSFRMYDLDGDGQISRDELFTVLEQMVEGIDPEELRRISERFITEIDISDVSNETHTIDSIKLIILIKSDWQDDLISLEEFLKVMDSCDAENKMSMKFRG